MMSLKTITLTVNGDLVSASVEPRTHLADFVREHLHLTGTHLGCEHGVCGACTLMIDGVPARSCITLATACDGATVTTIEGHDTDELMQVLRDAFSREHALQCGFCTPGMLASARDVVLRMPDATAQDVRAAMSGNLCRCTGYVGIVRAVQSVISERKITKEVAPIADVPRALGPAGARPGTPIPKPRETLVQTLAVKSPPPGRERLSASSTGKFKPHTTLQQSFTVNHPRKDVWVIFANLDEVSTCLPGTSLKRPSKDGHVEFTIRVKVGPISAEFDGIADVTRDSSTYTGVIYGSAHDTRSSSATRGEIRYRLAEGRNSTSTEVEVEVGFTLTGPLTQFSRSTIVQDIAKRMTTAFAKNLEARLNDSGDRKDIHQTNTLPARFDAGSLIVSVMWQRIKAFFRTLLK